MALPQAHRLRHRSDFDRVYRQGKRYRSKYLTLWVYWPPAIASPTDRPTHPPPHPSPPKIGVVISRKVDKRSVVRNRLRRWIHTGLCHLLPQLPPGWLAVIGVHPTALECNYQKLLQELEQLLAVVRPESHR
jgi:ribonuclease P protein component